MRKVFSLLLLISVLFITGSNGCNKTENVKGVAEKVVEKVDTTIGNNADAMYKTATFAPG